MKLTVSLASEKRERCDAVAYGIFEGEPDRPWEVSWFGAQSKKLLVEIAKSGRLSGKEGEIFFTYLPDFKLARGLYYIGLGKREKYDLKKLRSALGGLQKSAQKEKLRKLRLNLASVAPKGTNLWEASRAVGEALVLANYRFDQYKTKREDGKELEELSVLLSDSLEKRDVRSGLDAGVLIAQAVNQVRDLANEPANRLTPSRLAARAQSLAREAGVRCKVLDEAEIRRLRMGGLLGVAQGSPEPPRFIIMEYWNGGRAEKPTVLVGKGITFDSGGISIKPSEGMEKMKYDMSGAAAVVGSLWLAAKMKLAVNLIGLAPTCENLPSEKPQRPGDIITISNGKTVEVVNTDAEGRLILADGLSYAARYKPQAIIDLATLTYSCRATFGELCIGMMGNDASLIEKVKEAGEKSGERVWELPLWEDYRDHIKSDVADIKNVGKGVAGAISAGKFLEEFVGDFPWVHLDIASTAWLDSDQSPFTKGPSGAGVRVVNQFLRDSV